MAATTIGNIQFSAKTEYDKMMREIPNVEPRLYHHLEMLDLFFNGTGQFSEMPLHTEGGMRGVGALEEGGLMAPHDDPTGTTARIFHKTNAFPVEITDQARLAIRKNATAYVDLLTKAVEWRKNWALEQQSRQCWSDGFGVLGVVASIAGGGSPSTVTFDSSTNMNYFRKGMRIDFWAPAYTLADRKVGSDGTTNDITTRDVGYQITAVNEATRTITVTGDVADATDPVDPGDWALIENTGLGINAAAAGSNLASGKEITGFRALASNGNIISTIQNVNLTTFPELQARINGNGGVLRDITLDMLQDAEDFIERRTGRAVDFVGMYYGQRRKLLNLGLPDVRHTSQEILLGYRKIDWNGHPLFIDRLAPRQKIFVAALKGNYGRVELEGWHPVDSTELGLRRTSALDFQWAYGHYCNLAVVNSQGGVWIDDLNDLGL